MTTPAGADLMTTPDSLAAGDLMVLDESGTYEQRRSVVPIARLTATQVIISGRKNAFGEATTRRFRRDGFRKEVGVDGWHTPTLRLATPELVAEVHEENRRKALIHRIQTTKLNALTTAQLQQINDALDKEKP